MIVLGIDPGYAFMGVAILLVQPSSVRVVHQETFTTTTKDDELARLDAIADHLGDVIDTFTPDFIGYENQAIVEVGAQRARAKDGDDDSFGSNYSSRRVHEVSGIIRCAARFYALPLYCLAPATIKVAVLGKGGARKGKAAMKDAVRAIFKVTASEHGADAIAIGIAALNAHRKKQAGLRSASALIH